MATVTQRQIAARTGVSCSAVSQILRGQQNTSFAPETVRKVIEAAQNLGYRLPAQAANRLVGVIVRGGIRSVFRNSYFSTIYDSMERTFWEKDYHLVFSSRADDTEGGEALPRFLSKGVVSGIVVFDDIGTAEDLLAAGLTVVSVNHSMPNSRVDSVVPDCFRGSYLATRHLHKKGHQRIAHLAGPIANRNFVSRLWGYRQAMIDLGLPVSPELIMQSEPGSGSEEFGYEAVRKRLQEQGKPLGFTALTAANDQMALGAIAALRDAGMSVPGDVSIIGSDDIDEASQVEPALTTIHVPQRELGRIAAIRMMERLEGVNTGMGVQIVLPVHLVERESVRVLT